MELGCTVTQHLAAVERQSARRGPSTIVTTLPISERAAVAPRATVTGGRISSRSCSIHQRHASISPASGLLWMRRLPRCDELEMLDRIGDVDGRRGRSRPSPAPRRTVGRRAHERPAGQVLLVARLLADEHDGGIERPLAEHRLGAELVEVAPRAVARVLEQRFPRGADRLPPGSIRRSASSASPVLPLRQSGRSSRAPGSRARDQAAERAKSPACCAKFPRHLRSMARSVPSISNVPYSNSHLAVRLQAVGVSTVTAMKNSLRFAASLLPLARHRRSTAARRP